jgi:hypothetical protein
MRNVLPVMLGVMAAGVLVAGVIGVGRLTASSQEGGATVVRWRNVEIEAPPDGSLLRVSTQHPPSPAHRWLVSIVVRDVDPPVPGEEDKWVQQQLDIDAETGEILSDTLSLAYPAETRAILDTMKVVTGSPPAVWPYVDAAPPTATRTYENMTYPVPDPASGLIAVVMQGFCAVTVACDALLLSNGDSWMHVSLHTGEVVARGVHSDAGQALETGRVRPEDAPMFDRFLSRIIMSSTTAP